MNHAILAILVAAAIQGVEIESPIHRRPMERSSVRYESPVGYELGEEFDNSKGEFYRYDPKYEIVLLDPPVAGVYEFRWIAASGERRTERYQRPDAIQLTVEASATRTSDGQYRFEYHLRNAITSPTHLASFALQTIGNDARGFADEGVRVGEFRVPVRELGEGRWLNFGLGFFDAESKCAPGSEIVFVVYSAKPPALVNCRAFGGAVLLNVGSDFPGVFEDIYSQNFFKLCGSGVTIGPSETIAKMTASERRVYIGSKLQAMVDLGWLTSEAREWYAANLKSSRGEILVRLESDLKANRITSEVYALIKQAL